MSGFIVRDRQVHTHDRVPRARAGLQTGLLFHPRFSLANGQLVAMEATALRPGGFASCSSSRDVARDGALLRQACRMAAARNAVLPVLSIAVTEAQAACGMLAPLIADALGECELAPERLELEFCGDSLHADQADLLYLLAALRNLGVRLVLGGFGGPVSSLTLLRRRRLAGLLTGIRLHPLLAQQIGASAPDAACARGLIAAAHAFGLVVAAGGVDSKLHQQKLLEAGCDEGSGEWLGVAQTGFEAVRLSQNARSH